MPRRGRRFWKSDRGILRSLGVVNEHENKVGRRNTFFGIDHDGVDRRIRDLWTTLTEGHRGRAEGTGTTLDIAATTTATNAGGFQWMDNFGAPWRADNIQPYMGEHLPRVVAEVDDAPDTPDGPDDQEDGYED